MDEYFLQVFYAAYSAFSTQKKNRNQPVIISYGAVIVVTGNYCILILILSLSQAMHRRDLIKYYQERSASNIRRFVVCVHCPWHFRNALMYRDTNTTTNLLADTWSNFTNASLKTVTEWEWEFIYLVLSNSDSQALKPHTNQLYLYCDIFGVTMRNLLYAAHRASICLFLPRVGWFYAAKWIGKVLNAEIGIHLLLSKLISINLFFISMPFVFIVSNHAYNNKHY